MKISNINSIKERNIVFEGKRTDRNAVKQLARNNKYSLSEPNQRYISTSIENLGKVKGSKNINFLLDTAAKNTYKTNIVLKDAPKNNWTAKLLAAAAAAIAITPFVSKQIKEKIAKLSQPQDLNETELQILDLRKELLELVDLEQIKKETNGTMKDFEKNLDYFIVSSETTLAHKKYVLERLNYFMSDDYEINPQLDGKKSIAIAEMVNDMAICVPGNEVPNIKAVNQRRHGICAAISIVRKKLAYEDKPNYVDAIISELDSSPYLTVYDRNELGSGKKTQVRKVPVDFTTALERGYRIIDASTTHWMQVAHMNGKNDVAYSEYTPFNKENFDVMTDSFYNVKMSDEGLARTQAYYQSLLQAKSVIEGYKARSIKRDFKNNQAKANFDENVELMGRTTSLIKEKLFNLNPNMTKEETQTLLSNILELEKKSSEKIEKGDKYSYIANEEEQVIKERIKNYILDNSSIKNIDDKTFDSIFDLMNYYKSLDAQTEQINPSKKPINKAQQLYEVGAAFRYQVVTGLQEPETLKNSMMINGVVDEDTLIIETIDTLLDRLNNDASDSDLIIEQLAPQVLEFGEANKHNTIEWLSALKEATQTVLTETLDSLYYAMALGNRKQVLYNTLENLKYVAVTADKATLENLSLLLNTSKKNEDIIDKIDTMQERVTNGDETDYIEILNALGNKSQIELVANGLRALVKNINEEESGQSLQAFLAVNGIEDGSNPNDFIAQLKLIEDSINNINAVLREYASILKIVDKDGDVLYSANPQDVIIKKMENKNQIPSAKSLRELQTHLDKVAAHRAQNEFGKAGKITDKSLLKFSNREKQTLKNLEESINPMLTYVHKQLNAVQKGEFKESLEELNRIIGLNTGDYWVSEAHGGLAKSQQARILEYMTGRPHYVTKDWKKAVEKIKTTPYSGISGMQVSHNSPGGHAQYIADIAPVEVETKDKDGQVKKETVDVLFHDNTWGGVEKENTWVDSQGLLRTDYNNEYGGTQGYITNDKMQNGNKVSRIMNDMLFRLEPDTTNSKAYKKIKHNDPLASPYIMPQYTDVVLDGCSPEANDIAGQIHDLMFMPNTENIDALEKSLQNTIEKIKKENPEANISDEISAIITSLKHSGKSWKSTYKELKQRIFPIHGEGIKTKEDYDKLANDDYLKVVLEKIALKQNYQVYVRESELAMVRDVKGLDKFKTSQKARAMNAFKYAFSKTTPILDYLAEEMGVIQEYNIQNILAKYGITLTPEESMLIADIFDIPKEEFTGSAKDTINYLMNVWAEDIDNLITNPDANKEVKEYLHKFLKDKIYFTKKDIDTKRLEHLVKFIDREFDPIDDNEFVKTFNRIQDMTMEEFKKEILPKVKPEDLNIKDVTGYDVLKKIQYYNKDMNTNLINTVFYDSLVPEINPKETKFEYKPKRFYRTTAMNLNDREFNLLYRLISNDIYLLTLPKLFNKYKDDGVTMHNAYPAYPKLDYLTDEVISTSFDSITETISNNIETVKTCKDQIENYNLNHRLMNYMKKLSPTDVLSDYQYKNLNLILGELITLNLTDDTISEVIDAAADLMDLPKGTPWSEYINGMETVTKMFSRLEATTSKAFLQETADKAEMMISGGIKGFVGSQIQERYRNKLTKIFNDLKQAYIENDEMEIERLRNILYAETELSNILQTPEELLEFFVLSQAPDSPLHPFREAYKIYLTRCVQFATLAEMQELMMQALDEGIAPSVRKMFSTFTIELKNDLPASMNSEKMISAMVHKLILDNQLETAQMFIEKFGLGDAYISFMAKQIDFDSMREIIKEAYEASRDFSAFQSTMNPFFEEASNLLKLENVDYNKIMNELKKAVRAVGEANNIDKKDIKVLLKSLDLVKENIAANPEGDPVLYYNAVMNGAKAQVANNLQQKLNMANDVIKSNATIFELIESIGLKPGRVNDVRSELLSKFNDLVAYKQELINLQQAENSATI